MNDNKAAPLEAGRGSEMGAGAAFSAPHHTPTEKRTPIYFNGQVVMTVTDGRAIRHAKPEHQLRTPPAWALNESVYRQCQDAGAEWYVTICGNETFTVSAAVMEVKGFWIERGFGRQWALPLSYWTVTTTKAGPFSAPTATPSAQFTEPTTTPKPTRRATKFTPPPLSGVEFSGAQLSLFADTARAAEAVLDDVGLLPNGKHRKAARKAAERMTRALAQTICAEAVKGGGQ